MRCTAWIASLLVASGAAAETGSFLPRPVAPEVGVSILNRAAAERLVGRSLLHDPAASAVWGEVHVYDRFPYVEGRYVHVTSDAQWSRILYGEPGEAPRAFGSAGSGPGQFREPRGLCFAPDGRLFVADRTLGRVTVLQVRRQGELSILEYVGQIDGLVQPSDVAVHDGGTPAIAADDRLLVAESGAHRIAMYELRSGGAVRLAEFGARGSRDGEFLYPRAIAVGREGGASNDAVYVADAGNHRLVEVDLVSGRFTWHGSTVLPMEATSIDTDHNGNLYLATRRDGSVMKMSPRFEILARWSGGGTPLASPRDVAIPFAWVHDHRPGAAAPAWKGQGTALVLESWGTSTGVRRVDLGVEITDVQRRTDAGLDVVLTDAAHLAARLVSKSGAVQDVDLGRRSAGTQRVELPALADAARLTLVAISEYDGTRRAERTLELAALAPARLELRQNVPNPFNPTTVIAFAMPQEGNARLEVYDVQGRRVRTLLHGRMEAGLHQVTWDGRNTAGRRVSSGVYFYRLDAAQTSRVRKMVLAQ